MATTTVATLIARAQASSDQEDEFVTRTQWLYWVNLFNKQLAVMVAQLGYPYHQYDETISLNGSLEYTIDEPLALLGAYYVESDGRLRRLKLMNPVQARQIGNYQAGEPRRYVVHRNTDNDLTFQFQPVPTSGSVLIQAIQMPAELVYADSVKYPLGWEEFIVLNMARNALAKEETINPLIESQLRDIKEHIQVSAANYIMASAPTIRNVKDENYWEDSEWLWV